MRYEVQHKMLEGWKNTWFQNDKSLTFASRKAAKKELDDFLASVGEAVANGDMDRGYSRKEYRIVPVKK